MPNRAAWVFCVVDIVFGIAAVNSSEGAKFCDCY
jgi:hypothetical protein